MKVGKIKIAITYGLLLYFLCFIVPPVSSIIPSSASFAVSKDVDTIGKDTTRERMYLFDLTFWEILNRAKRSDSMTAVLLQGSDNQRQHIADEIGIIDRDWGMLSLLTSIPSRAPKVKIHHMAGFLFAYSGLSPPVLA